MSILIKNINLLTIRENDEIVKTDILIEENYIKEIGNIWEINAKEIIFEDFSLFNNAF